MSKKSDVEIKQKIKNVAKSKWGDYLILGLFVAWYLYFTPSVSLLLFAIILVLIMIHIQLSNYLMLYKKYSKRLDKRQEVRDEQDER
jgi:membrane protein implicated in regulation of membrane protease activity